MAMTAYGGPIRNVVVVMFENRSYDNVLGWLYNSANPAPFKTPPPKQAALNGLTGSETNANPSGGAPIPVGHAVTTWSGYPGTAVPVIDPGEAFEAMAQQILGLTTPPSPAVNPYANGAPGTLGFMQGFAYNYALQSTVTPGLYVTLTDVMNYFTPSQMPATALLANAFAVCDQWFASAPCQTFPNRTFAHCAAPGVSDILGIHTYLLNDADYILRTSLPSVFAVLDQAYPSAVGSSVPNWKVYYQDLPLSALLVPYVAGAPISQLVPFDPTFYDDLSKGTLPKYAFIEPRYYIDPESPSLVPSSNHPGNSGLIPGPLTPYGSTGQTNPPIDAAQGDQLLASIALALMLTGLGTGPVNYWEQSLLVMTYDEHGGTYDHVTPPTAVNPIAGGRALNGFDCTRYGVRVPAVVISPYVLAGSTITPPGSTPFDHSSIVKTVWECFNLASLTGVASLTQRDLNAPSLLDALTSTSDRRTSVLPRLRASAAPRRPAPAPSEAARRRILAALRDRTFRR